MVEDPQKGHSPGVPSLTFFPRLAPVTTRTRKNVKGGIHGQPRSGAHLPAQKEAAARTSSVVSDDPATDNVTTLLMRRWDGRYVPEGRI
jgi:hypothetical protein